MPLRKAVLLPADASLQLGACLGVPFLTAHRCLTLGESMPDRLDPGALAGKTGWSTAAPARSATRRSSWPSGPTRG